MYIISHLYVGVMKYHNLLFEQPSILCTFAFESACQLQLCARMCTVYSSVVILKTQTACLR